MFGMAVTFEAVFVTTVTVIAVSVTVVTATAVGGKMMNVTAGPVTSDAFVLTITALP